MMIIGKQFEGMRPKPPDKPLGNAVSTVRKLRARRNRHAMKNNDNFTGTFNTIKKLIPGTNYGNGANAIYRYPSFTYTGEIKNGKPHGKGYAKFLEEWEKQTYEGEFKNGIMEGMGIYINNVSFIEQTRWRYEGSFKDNIYHGQGKLEYGYKPDSKYNMNEPYASSIEGEFKYGVLNGYGVSHDWPIPGHGVYRGEWKNGNKNGQGVRTNFSIIGFSDYEKYEGEWKNNKRHGQGIATYKNGSRYEGKWENDKKHGHGVKTWANGKKYDGEYKDDNIHGRGIIIYTNGNKYDGEFKNDFKHGHGVYTWNDVSRYEGNWYEDSVSIANGHNGRNGYGVMIWSKTINWTEEKWAQGQEPKLRFEGEWKNHHELKGTVLYVDGRKYEGEFDKRKRHGHGIMTYTEGNKYDGEWKDGNKNGQGVLTWSNGSHYVGEWENGKKWTGMETKPDGTVLYRYKDGSKYGGEWKDGKRHGHGVWTNADGRKYDGEFKDGKKWTGTETKPDGTVLYRYKYGSKYGGEWKEHLEEHNKRALKTDLKLREENKKEVLRILQRIKLICLEPTLLNEKKELKGSDIMLLQFHFRNLRICEQVDRNKANRNKFVKCSYEPKNKFNQSIPSNLNYLRIKELLLEHLIKNKIKPDDLSTSNINEMGFDTPSSISSSSFASNSLLIKTDDPEVFIQIKACSSIIEWCYKNMETKEVKKQKFYYRFYIKLMNITKGNDSTYKNIKYIKVGVTKSQEISIKSKRCYWGYDTGGSSATWLEDIDYDSNFKSPPKSVVDSDTLVINLPWDKIWLGKFDDIITSLNTPGIEPAIYPVKDNNIDRLGDNCYHWLGDEISGSIFECFTHSSGLFPPHCPVPNYSSENEKMHRVDEVKYNILRVLNLFYLPNENGKVKAYAFKNGELKTYESRYGIIH